MGLLDDAIREHLDLKRRRGADPTEVERAEREALGPVRRGPEGRDQVEPRPDDASAYNHEGEPDWNEAGDEHIPTGVVEAEPLAPDFGGETGASEPFADEVGADLGEHEPFEQDFGSHPDEPEPLALEEPPRRRGFLGRRKQAPSRPEHEQSLEPQADDDPFAQDDPRPPSESHAPRHAPPAGSDRSRDQAGGETVEYEVEAALEAERQNEGEDVLEETPEFLQDTPDHDRLWFEQRPPRDFDFDS